MTRVDRCNLKHLTFCTLARGALPLHDILRVEHDFASLSVTYHQSSSLSFAISFASLSFISNTTPVRLIAAMSANPDRATPPGAGAGAGPPLPQEALDAMFWVDTTLYVFSCFFACVAFLGTALPSLTPIFMPWLTSLTLCLCRILCYDMVVAFSQEYKLIWKSRNSVIKWLYLFTSASSRLLLSMRFQLILCRSSSRYWAFIAMLITLVMCELQHYLHLQSCSPADYWSFNRQRRGHHRTVWQVCQGGASRAHWHCSWLPGNPPCSCTRHVEPVHHLAGRLWRSACSRSCL